MIYLVAVYSESVLSPKMGFNSAFMKRHYDKRLIELETMPSDEELKKLVQKHYKEYHSLPYFHIFLKVKYYLVTNSEYAPLIKSKIYKKLDIHGNEMDLTPLKHVME